MEMEKTGEEGEGAGEDGSASFSREPEKIARSRSGSVRRGWADPQARIAPARMSSVRCKGSNAISRCAITSKTIILEIKLAPERLDIHADLDPLRQISASHVSEHAPQGF